MVTRNETPTPFMAVHVGLMLKAELHERGISQRELAAMLGLSATHVSELIRGKRSLTPEVAIKIEQTLGLPSAALLAMQDRYEYDLEVIRRRETTTNAMSQSQMAEKPSASKEQAETKQDCPTGGKPTLSLKHSQPLAL